MRKGIRSFVLWFAVALAAVWLVAGPSTGWGQVVTGTISGVVTDHSGAVIPAVKVLAVSPETGLQRETETNQQGIFNILTLPVGRYTLRAEKTGFSTSVKENLSLEVDRTLRLDITLEVGTVKQTVEVVGSAVQLLKPETSDLGQVVNSQTVATLPLNGREFWTLAYLAPGVAAGPWNIGGGGPALGFRSLSVNGGRVDANLFLTDGLDNREMDANQDENPPNLDGIAEFAIHTNTYSAVYGSAAGAIVSVQTKSGTNKMHGSLFEFLRNDAVDAANFFSNRNNLAKNPLRFNQFGGSIGGPIVRNKTFFFAEYQGDRVSRGAVGTFTVPTIARRNGDFSDLLAGSNPVQLLNTRTFQPVPGNVIDPATMDPPARAMAQLLPDPNLPGTQLNFATNLVNRRRWDNLSVKVDHMFSATDSLSVRYAYFKQFKTTPVAFGKTLGGPPFIGGTDSLRRPALSLAEIHTFGATTVNEFRLGWSWGNRDLLNTDFDQDTAGQFGIPNITINSVTKGLPWILFAGGGSDWIGSSIYEPQLLGYANYQFHDTLSMSRGKHRIQVGGQFMRRHFNVFQTGFPRGFYIYLGLSSLLGTGQIIPGADFADFLIGSPYTVQRDYMKGKVGLRNFSLAGFLQDDIKVSPRFTVNLGIRYDVAPPWLEVYNRISNFDPATGGLIQASPDAKYGRRLVQTDANNIAPRVGFSYALTSDSKTLLRGGFGMFYFDVGNAPGTLPQLTYNAPNFYLQNGPAFPSVPPLSVGFPILPMAPLNTPSGTVMYHPVDTVTSSSIQWNLNLQREIIGNTVLEVAYVGTRGLHLPLYVNGNQPLLDAQGNQIRPYSSAISGLKTWASWAYSGYHGLQVKAEHRMSHGVQFLAGYTYSKSIDNNSQGPWTNASTAQNNYNLRVERALSDFDVRNRFTVGYIWEIPFFRKAQNRLVKGGLGGWQMNGNTTLSAGQPWTPTITAAQAGLINSLFNDPTVTDIGFMRPNLLKDPNLPAGQRTIDRWYDVSAFDILFPNQPHNVATFGNAGRNIITGPGLATTDLSFFKEFYPKEGWKIQFRAEFFNIFNRVNLHPPITTVNQNGGRITSAEPGREIQFGLRVEF